MRTAALAILILLQPGLRAAQDDAQQRARAFIARAAELSDIQAESGASFTLRAQVRLLGMSEGEEVGTYALAWQSRDTWRAQIDLPGDYQDVQIFNANREWRRTTTNQASLRVAQLRHLLGFVTRLKWRGRETVKRPPRLRDINGASMVCLNVEDAREVEHELCFDAAGALVREDYAIGVNEYSDFEQWGPQVFPRTLRAFVGDELDELVVEVRIETLTPGVADPTWFELPEGAEWMHKPQDGEITAPKLVKRVTPEYYPAATRAGIEGRVFLEAVIAEDGTVASPRLIQGISDWELNRRAIASILQWRFEPGLKEGQPVPVLSLFTIEYRIH